MLLMIQWSVFLCVEKIARFCTNRQSDIYHYIYYTNTLLIENDTCMVINDEDTDKATALQCRLALRLTLHGCSLGAKYN
jgi:hypothetical protein